MTASAPTSTRILVQIDAGQKADRDILGGVLRYAATHQDWDVRIVSGHPMTRASGIPRPWRPNGIVTDRVPDGSLVARLAREGLRGIIALYDDPAFDPKVRGAPVRHVLCDNEAIGEEGARLLLAKKLRHFAYVPAIVADQPLDRRQTGFVRIVAEHGFEAAVYPAPPHPRGKRRSQSDDVHLAEWLAALPKPCGVMAAFDQRAKNVLDACRLAGVDVPAQVMLLGVDNEEFICDNTVPSLSSILPDFNGGGFLAAKVLQQMIDGKNGSSKDPIRYGIGRVVERASTVDVGGTARSVALACEFMRRNAASPIGIDDIVAASGTSRRLLERHFRAVMGTTAAHELQRIRLELVKRRLEETDEPLGRVGDACGFNDESHLKKLFKRAFGMRMGDYRRIARSSEFRPLNSLDSSL